MALQSSGEIKLTQIQAEFGGSGQIGIAEYYKGGVNTPSTITTGNAAGSYTSYLRTPSAHSGQAFTSIGTDWVIMAIGGFGTSRVFWGGVSLSPTSSVSATTITSGIYEYERGSFGSTLHFGDKAFPTTVTSYSVRRRVAATTSTITVNANIPTSGEVKFSDMYGGRET